MKLNIIKIITLICCSIIFASAVAAQDKPRALKFDEFSDINERGFYSTFEERVQRFIKQVEKERGVRVFIIYYQARITTKDYFDDIVRIAGNLKNEIVFNDKAKVQEVYIIDGGYRESRAIEFWIVPKNAEPPQPTPTIDKSETYICPKLGVYGSYSPKEPNTLTFSGSANGIKDFSKYTLKWKVSGGEIIGENGLEEVKVKLNDNRTRATAYMEIEGLPFPCLKVFSATAETKGKLLLVDDFGRETLEVIQARLDNYFSQLQSNPTARGYIINYGGRLKGDMNLARRIRLIHDQIGFRNVDTSRITFIDGGYREDIATELWLSFDDNQKPVPTPTIDKRFVKNSLPKKPRR